MAHQRARTQAWAVAVVVAVVVVMAVVVFRPLWRRLQSSASNLPTFPFLELGDRRILPPLPASTGRFLVVTRCGQENRILYQSKTKLIARMWLGLIVSFRFLSLAGHQPHLSLCTTA